MGVNKVQYGSQVLLDISDATVTPEQLVKGAVAYNAAGERIVGTLNMNLYAPPGMVSPYAGSTAPEGWLLCDGATLQSERYPELYAAIGTTYGQDKAGTFKLPDLRGNVPAGVTSGHALASKEGERTHRQTVEELVGHSHDAAGWAPKDTSSAQYTGLAAFRGNAWDVVSSISKWSYEGGSGIKFEGGGQPFNIMQPTLYLNYIIKY